MHVSNLFYTEPAMRLAERLSRVEPRRQGVLLQLRRRGQRGGDQARAQGPPAAATSWSSTAPSTAAPTARCRRRRRSQSRRRSRRSCPASARSLPTPDGARARRSTSAPPRCCSSRSRARAGVNVLSDETAPRRARGLRRARRGARSSTRSSPGWAAPARCGPTSRPASCPTRSRRQGARRRTADRRARSPASASRTCSQPGDHGSTFAGGPLVAAAALAALEVTDDPALLDRVRELGRGSRRAWKRLPHVRLGARARADARLRARHPRARRSQRRALLGSG